MPLITLADVRSSPADFVAFWSRRYYDKHESLYTSNINACRTPDALRELFHWKAGDWMFTHRLPVIERHFISRLDELNRLPGDTTPEAFLRMFHQGGAIWRIFWLHCWNQKYPIYDQHVHRAMSFVEDGSGEELEPYSDEAKVTMYLGRYLPFTHQFDGINGREVDRALWVFGKFLKTPYAHPRTG